MHRTDLPEMNEDAKRAIAELGVHDSIWARDIAKWDYLSWLRSDEADSANASEVYSGLVVRACRRFVPKERMT